MNSNLLLCQINSSYLDYLRNFDSKVSLDPTKNRKFVGILFEINGFLYCAPLSSPKPKHKRLNEKAPDIYKIDNGELGLINLNNMIPVSKSVIIDIDISEEKDERYRNLMTKQAIDLRKNKELIRKKADRLYGIVKSGKQPKLNARCCDYILLESISPDFDLSHV